MVTRLTLPNGQWFDVKDRLKVRDKKEIHGYSVEGVATDGLTYRFSVVKHQIASAAVRITNWSLVDEAGKAIVYPSGRPFKDRVTVIEDLDEAAFEAVTDMLNEHVKVVEGESADEKKETPDGETPSGPSSPSVN